MKATFLKEIPTARDMLSTFGGYDGRARIAEGSFADMKNLSSRDYPVMSVRKERAELGEVHGVQGVIAKEKLAWVANNKFYYDGAEISNVNLTDGEKTIVAMGANIIIYPDQILYNTATEECKRIMKSEILADICFEVANNNSGTAVERIFLHINSDDNGLVTDDHVKGFFEEIKNTDIVLFKGTDRVINFTVSDQDYYKYIYDYFFVLESDREWTVEQVYENIPTAEYDSEVRIDLLTGNEYTAIKCLRVMDYSLNYPPSPKLDGIFESGNRLWGYRYGENNQGDFVNEIYSTALGDPVAWDTFEGLASDSYAVSVGSDGVFTGAAYYSGSLYFFKENCLHKIMGLKPASYQLITLSCHGIEAGSEKSLVALGDALYYKSDDGIYCYDGSIPYRISDVLGERRYKNAVGGAFGEKLYMEMEDEKGERVLFVYDTLKRLWYKEGAVGAKCFISAYGNLLYLSERGFGIIAGDEIDDTLTALFGDNVPREGNVKWFGEFGDFGLADPDAKYVSKLQLRMTVDEGARVTVEVMTDSSGSWVTAAVFSSQNKRSVCLPIVTPRCDHFRLRLSGVGGFKLWTMVKEVESTNEVR